MNTMAFALVSCLLSAQGQDPAVAPEQGVMQTDSRRDRARREPDEDTGFLYHLKWYGADYAASAALLGFAYGLWPMVEPGPALYGPRYDDKVADLAVLSASPAAYSLSGPYHADTVPSLWLYIGGSALAASSLTYDFIRHGDGHRMHNLLLGGVETIAVTYAMTEVLKTSVARLRPDFIDRATRYYCNPETQLNKPVAGLDCRQASQDGIYLDRDDFADGHQSFPSGHTSTSFALATYFALYLGGDAVWGEHATAYSVAPAAAAMMGLMGVASLVGATRVADNRHHIDDVAAGAALGATTAALFYFLHFDLDGNASYRGIDIHPVALYDGAALSIAWAL